MDINPAIYVPPTVSHFNLKDLTEKVIKYLNKIKPNCKFLGLNYYSENKIKATISTIDHTNTHHGYGDSKEIIETIQISIDELI